MRSHLYSPIISRYPSSSCDKSDAVFNRYVLYTWGNKLLLLHIQISIVHTVHIVISHMLCCSTATKLCKIYYYASAIYCFPLLIYFCSMDNWGGVVETASTLVIFKASFGRAHNGTYLPQHYYHCKSGINLSNFWSPTSKWRIAVAVFCKLQHARSILLIEGIKKWALIPTDWRTNIFSE